MNMGAVKLHGHWSSPFNYRIIWALKLKGIPFEYIEEDLYNKSPSLLQYNPVYKKIPILVHDGKPICESSIILEYIEETWPQNPLLPADPYERVMARFWLKFANEQGSAPWIMFSSSGEKQEKAKKQSLEMLKTLEEMALGDNKFFGGEKIGMVDIVFGKFAHWLGVLEEGGGEKLLEADKFPRLHAWVQNFKEVPTIKENLPDRDALLKKFNSIREGILASP
ncbi:probable glutathione S-transferase [Pistacia vera]|uniref:probable glutathione S-transferase n=1 Tax=Pistacia vera TaxID=55513 RepID=UPI0012637EFB|nr:probable glutathione S-transferase [Pistacia vera]